MQWLQLIMKWGSTSMFRRKSFSFPLFVWNRLKSVLDNSTSIINCRFFCWCKRLAKGQLAKPVAAVTSWSTWHRYKINTIPVCRDWHSDLYFTSSFQARQAARLATKSSGLTNIKIKMGAWASTQKESSATNHLLIWWLPEHRVDRPRSIWYIRRLSDTIALHKLCYTWKHIKRSTAKSHSAADLPSGFCLCSQVQSITST